MRRWRVVGPVLLILVGLPLAGLVTWWLLESIPRDSRIGSERFDPSSTSVERQVESTSAAVDSSLRDDVPERAAVTDPTLSRSTTRVHGFVRTRDTLERVTSGEVMLQGIDVVEFAGNDEEMRELAKTLVQELSVPLNSAPIAADGSFEMEAPLGAILVSAVLKPARGEGATQFIESVVPLESIELDGTQRELELLVDQGGSISGIVLDAASQLPIVGARVVAPWWDQESSDWGSFTDLDGRFRIAGIDPVVAAAGPSELAASAVGYVTKRTLVTPRHEEIHVRDVRIELQRGVVLRGKLEGGRLPRPVLRLHVGSHGSERSDRVEQLSLLASTGIVDFAGNFEFEAIPPTRDVTFEIEGLVPPIEMNGLDLETAPRPLHVVVPELRELSHVEHLLPQLERLSGPSTAWIAAAEGTRRLRSVRERPYVQLDIPLCLRLFTLDEAPPVGRRIEVAEKLLLYSSADSGWRMSEPAAAIAWELLEFEIKTGSPSSDAIFGAPPSLGLQIEFTVVRPDGRPLASTRVRVTDLTNDSSGTMSTDDSGRVRLDFFLGRRFLSVRVAGFHTQNLLVEASRPGRTSFRLALRPLGG